MVLYVCNHVNCPSAIPLRKQIEEGIRAGQTQEEIIAAIVAEHGEVVLSAPTAEGFNLAAWVVPFVMLAFGGVFLASFLGARRRRAAALAQGQQNAGYLSRVDRELDRFEDRE